MLTSLTTPTYSKTFQSLREKKPLILNVTNWVAMNSSANLLLALGASPMMAHALDELAELVRLADAVVLNIGTLDERWLESLFFAQQAALQHGRPIVLDPVGAGASQFRTHAAKTLLTRGVTVVRGNASEIMALVDEPCTTKGVDSTQSSHQAVQAAVTLADQFQCCVVVSGKDDLICDRSGATYCSGGDVMLTRITAMGCAASAIIAAFLAVENNAAVAGAFAMLTLSIAAETASKTAVGPGGFYSNLLDAIYQPFDGEDISKRFRVEVTC